MTIDLNRDTILRLRDAARKAGVHVATAHRWHLRGVRGIRLETALLGGFRVTTEEALARFVEHVTAAGDCPAIVPASPRRRVSDAEAVADAAGIGFGPTTDR